MDGSRTVLLAAYAQSVAETDQFEIGNTAQILQGLFGEVGGIMSTAKKHIRERSEYSRFLHAAEEEFGDTLWYLAALCRRQSITLDEIFRRAVSDGAFASVGAASDVLDSPFAAVARPVSSDTLDATLFRLGKSAANLLDDHVDLVALTAFARHYLEALHSAKISFASVATRNMRKTRGAFLAPVASELVDFDEAFGVDEQLPRNFRIRINQRSSGKSYLQMNGVFIGDPLTDNISDKDGYRFHDVFHLAFAEILHWSPVFRALLKRKRKSHSSYDEEQDGGRAIVVEEGLTAWVFSCAKDLGFFAGQNKVPLGLLKTVGEFVSGFEASRCPLKLWERAILDGFAVFREVKATEGGWVIGNRGTRTLSYEPLESTT